MLNIHHLELFYYVARHGGIAQAVRNMPYGIQQPAISAQIIALEDHLGAALFRRRPFELTSAGQRLFSFIEPFFSGLEGLEQGIRGGSTERLRVGASQTVLRNHLPRILRALRSRYRGLKLVLRSGYQQDLEKLLAAGEIDLAVTVVDRTIASGLHSEILIELPLALLVPLEAHAQSAMDILSADRLGEPLVSVRTDEAVPRMFHQELARRGLAWPTTIEVATLELVNTYVAEGFGIGMTVSVPGEKAPHGTRLLSLDDFPRVPIGLLWGTKLSSVGKHFTELLRTAARDLSAEGSHPASGNRRT